MSRTYAELSGLMTLMTGDEKHGPSATSTLDVLWVLYDQVLRVSPDTVDDPSRDRFLLSKGHGPTAYYAVLAAKGFFPESWLTDFGSAASRLGYHPDRNLIPSVEIASGSLGHGLPLGVGLAHGLIARGFAAPRVYVLVGGAELDEGSNSEAIVYAGAVGLPNLTVVAVDNRSSSYGWGRAGSRRSSRSAGGRRSASPAAIMPRWLRRSGPPRPGLLPVRRAGLSSWWPRSRERGEEVMTDMRTVFAAEASELLEEDPLTAVVLAEISADLFGKAAARHPDRVLNVGIREQLMVSVGGGLAGGGGGGGADARPGTRRGRRPGRDRGVHHHGPAVRRRRAAVAGGLFGCRRAG
jgi:transketolase